MAINYFYSIVCWALGIFLLAQGAVAKENERTTYSLQTRAFAANAGGQTAYALRRAHGQGEWALIANTYLTVGSTPLMAGGYDFRFPVGPQDSLLRFYVQAGGGVSNVGPYIELLWGTNFLGLFRLDIASHFYFPSSRPIMWSYPLWAGLSISL